MRKEITIVTIRCDYCKKECSEAKTIFETYDICEHCEHELKLVLDFNPEIAVVVTQEHHEKLAEQMEKLEQSVTNSVVPAEEKPKRGRKKKEETVEPPNTFKYVVDSLGLDMRKREDADLVEKAIEKLPENPTNQEIKEAIEAVPVYFQDCDEHKETLKENLVSMGFDFTDEEHRAEAMTIRLGLIQQRIDIKNLGEWILGNVERKDIDLPF